MQGLLGREIVHLSIFSFLSLPFDKWKIPGLGAAARRRTPAAYSYAPGTIEGVATAGAAGVVDIGSLTLAGVDTTGIIAHQALRMPANCTITPIQLSFPLFALHPFPIIGIRIIALALLALFAL